MASCAAFCGLIAPPSQRLMLAKGDAEPLGELLLGEVEVGADGAQ